MLTSSSPSLRDTLFPPLSTCSGPRHGNHGQRRILILICTESVAVWRGMHAVILWRIPSWVMLPNPLLLKVPPTSLSVSTFVNAGLQRALFTPSSVPPERKNENNPDLYTLYLSDEFAYLNSCDGLSAQKFTFSTPYWRKLVYAITYNCIFQSLVSTWSRELVLFRLKLPKMPPFFVARRIHHLRKGIWMDPFQVGPPPMATHAKSFAAWWWFVGNSTTGDPRLDLEEYSPQIAPCPLTASNSSCVLFGVFRRNDSLVHVLRISPYPSRKRMGLWPSVQERDRNWDLKWALSIKSWRIISILFGVCSMVAGQLAKAESYKTFHDSPRC